MRFSIYILFIFILHTAYGQQFSSYPESFVFFFNNYASLNPGHIPDSTKLYFSSSYRTRLGPFTKISNYAVTGERVFGQKEGRSHMIRGIFYNEKEGPYISRPRGYFNYGYKILLNKNLSISTGVALGIAGVSFSAPTASGSAVAQVPDGSVGISLRFREITLGGAAQQILNSVAVPLGSEIKYTTYYNGFFNWDHSLGSQWIFNTYYFMQLFQDRRSNHAAALQLTYHHLVGVGTGYHLNRGFFGLAKLFIAVKKDLIVMGGGYYQPAGREIFQSAGTVEFFVHYAYR